MDKIAISAVEEINMDPISFYGIVKNDPDFMTSIANLHVVFLRGRVDW
jgi:uncharacterized protein YegJ (DUF2314 family)